MTSEDNTDLDFSETSETPTGFPGHMLRQAREEQGLTIEDISRELRLTKQVLIGIENGDFGVVKSKVFAHGYIRSYARFLGLDAEPLIAAYDTNYGHADQKQLALKVNTGKQLAKSGDTWVKTISLLIIVLLVGASWWWWQNQGGAMAPISIGSITIQGSVGEGVAEVSSSEESLDQKQDDAFLATIGEVSNSQAVEADKLDEAVTAIGLNKDTRDSQTLTEDDSVVEGQSAVGIVAEQDSLNKAFEDTTLLATSKASDSQASDADGAGVIKEGVEQTNQVSSTQSAFDNSVIGVGQGQLKITFQADCWVEIKDASGNIAISAMLTKNEDIDLVLDAPVKVLLGLASAVKSFQFANKDVNLEPYTRKGIARLTLEL